MDDAGGGGAAGGLTGRQWATLLVLTLSTFLVLVDASVVNLALPQVVGDLGGTLDGATWVVAGYILAFASLLLHFGRLGDVFGRRKMFLWGVAIFTASSLVAALASSLGVLVTARVAQGVGAAMLTPSTLSLVKAAFPREKLGLAFGVEGVTAGVATAVGPTLGGVLTTSFSWRWVFLVNIPLGLLAMAAAILVISESRDEAASRRIDVPGALLSGSGVFLLVFALVEGEKLGWGSAAVLCSLAAAATLLALFVLVERRVREPLVDLSLFRDRLFAAGNVLRGLVLFVLLATVFVLPLYWQTQLGYTALQSALLLLPLSVVSFFLSPVAGALADRTDARWLAGVGFVLAAAGTFWLSRFSSDAGWGFFVAPLALFGAGLSFLLAPTITATLRNVPEEKSGVASGIATASGEVGSALGLAVVAAALQNRLLANAEDSISRVGLPPRAEQGVLSSLSSGGLGEVRGFGADLQDAGTVTDVIQEAFAGAVSSGLLLVTAVGLLGAALALILFSDRPYGATSVEFAREGDALDDGAAHLDYAGNDPPGDQGPAPRPRAPRSPSTTLPSRGEPRR